MRVRTALVLLAVVGLAAACSSGGSKAAAGGAGARGATSSRTVEAPCLSDNAEAAQHVTHFTTADGADTVEAYTLGDGPVGVVLAHQSHADLCQWEPMMGDFTAKGYRVMAVTLGNHIEADVVAAAGQLRAHGATKIVLIGASMGGTASLVAATQLQPAPACVVSLSGPTAYTTANAYEAVKKLATPVQFYAGALDSEFADDARLMDKAATGPDHSLHIIEANSGHGVDLWPTVSPDVFAFIAKYTKG